MIFLYLILLLGSLSIPLLFTLFYKDLIRDWKEFLISTTIVAFIFLVWDAYFTSLGVWHFSENYTMGIRLMGMPIEEWLFFFIIPFCSLFIHFVFTFYYPNLQLGQALTYTLSFIFMGVSAVIIGFHADKIYTLFNYSLLIITLLIGILFNIKLLQKFYITFLVILLPFLIVNGILTGAITQTPVVSYDNLENLSIRIATIPIEDFAYAFTMLFINLCLFSYFRTLKPTKNVSIS